jgi:hypothetical protein
MLKHPSGLTDSDEFLGRVNCVVIDAAKGLGNGDMLEDEDDDSNGDIWCDDREKLGVHHRSTSMLKACMQLVRAKRNIKTLE